MKRQRVMTGYDAIVDLSRESSSLRAFPRRSQPVIKRLPLTALMTPCGPPFAGASLDPVGTHLVLVVWGRDSIILACAGSAGLSSYSGPVLL